MILKDLFYDWNGIARGIIEGDSGIEYCTNLDSEIGRSWCSCPRYVYEGEMCKHITYLLGKVEYNKMVKKDDLNFLETGSKIIDDMLGGGIPYGIVTAIFAEPTTGKTMFAQQIGFANIKHTNKKTLLIETEGLRTYDVRLIQYKFMNRWNLDADKVNSMFEVEHTIGDTQLQSIQKLLKMFGYMVTFDISKNGKYSTTFQKCNPSIKDEQLKDISMIIIDSLTKPIKDSVGSETMNLPARAQLTERLFGQLYHIAMIHNIAIMVTHHSTYNPIMPFGRDLGKPYGGDPILYNSKYAIQFIDSTRKIQNETGWGIEARRIKLLRSPGIQTTEELIPIRLKKDYGFTDE